MHETMVSQLKVPITGNRMDGGKELHGWNNDGENGKNTHGSGLEVWGNLLLILRGQRPTISLEQHLSFHDDGVTYCIQWGGKLV